MYTSKGLRELSQILRNARNKEPVRQFARRIGVSHRTIIRIENQEVKIPSNEVLEKIGDSCGYKLSELITILRGEEVDREPSPTCDDVEETILRMEISELVKTMHVLTDTIARRVKIQEFEE